MHAEISKGADNLREASIILVLPQCWLAARVALVGEDASVLPTAPPYPESLGSYIARQRLHPGDEPAGLSVLEGEGTLTLTANS